MCQKLRTRSCGFLLLVFCLANALLLGLWVYPRYWGTKANCRQRPRRVGAVGPGHVTTTLSAERMRAVQAKRLIAPPPGASAAAAAAAAATTAADGKPKSGKPTAAAAAAAASGRRRAPTVDDPFDPAEYHKFFADYVALHNRITDPADTGPDAPPKRFLVAENHPHSGICNRILNTLSALLLAALSDRALLIDWEHSDEQRYDDPIQSSQNSEAISQTAWEQLFVAPPFRVYRLSQLDASIRRVWERDPSQFVKYGPKQPLERAMVCGSIGDNLGAAAVLSIFNYAWYAAPVFRNVRHAARLDRVFGTDYTVFQKLGAFLLRPAPAIQQQLSEFVAKHSHTPGSAHCAVGLQVRRSWSRPTGGNDHFVACALDALAARARLANQTLAVALAAATAPADASAAAPVADTGDGSGGDDPAMETAGVRSGLLQPQQLHVRTDLRTKPAATAAPATSAAPAAKKATKPVAAATADAAASASAAHHDDEEDDENHLFSGRRGNSHLAAPGAAPRFAEAHESGSNGGAPMAGSDAEFEMTADDAHAHGWAAAPDAPATIGPDDPFDDDDDHEYDASLDFSKVAGAAAAAAATAAGESSPNPPPMPGGASDDDSSAAISELLLHGSARDRALDRLADDADAHVDTDNSVWLETDARVGGKATGKAKAKPWSAAAQATAAAPTPAASSNRGGDDSGKPLHTVQAPPGVRSRGPVRMAPADAMWYLSSDDKPSREYIAARIPQLHFDDANDDLACRNDARCHERSVFDLFALSRCDVIVTTAMSTFGRCAAALAGVTPYSVDHNGLCYQERIADPVGAGWLNAELLYTPVIVPHSVAAAVAGAIGTAIVLAMFWVHRRATATTATARR